MPVKHVLKVNGYGGRQAKGNEKRQCFKGWETLVNKLHKQIYTNSGKECHFEPFCHNITFISS